MAQRRRLRRAVFASLAVALLYLGSLAFNAATSENKYPGPLDLIRTHPWMVLLVLLPLAVVGLWPYGEQSDEKRNELPIPSLLTTFRLPTRHSRFVGRGAQLARLAQALSRGSTGRIVALHGMGGIGKTQLAIEYAYRHLGDYDFIGFLDAERVELLGPQFVALAADLGIPNATPEQAITGCYHRLAGRRNWLLILDNGGSPTELGRFLPSGRAATKGDVIVTTRHGGWASRSDVIDLEVFNRTESIALLASRGQGIELASAADSICELLGDLPLALEQAAAYIDYNGTPADEYLALLSTRLEDMLADGDVDDRPGVVVATLWTINLANLGKKSPAAVRLLQLCAMLAPEPIPMDLFVENSSFLPSPLGEAAADTRIWTATVGAIVGLSLSRRDGATLIFHRLVQAAIRRDMTDAMRNLTYANVCRLLVAATSADIEVNPATWPQWQRLIVHALAVTEHAPPSTATSCTAQLLVRSARYLRTIGSPITAHPLAERGLALHEQILGNDDVQVGTDLTILARILRDMGQLKAAEPLVKRALGIHEKTYAPRHPEVGFDLIILAQVTRDLGDLENARQFAARALAVHEDFYGVNHPQVGFDLTILSRILRDLGDATTALGFAERALAIDESVYGPSHPEVGTDSSILARVHQDLHNFDLASTFAARAVTVNENSYGPEHPEVATALTIAAQIHRELGELSVARHEAERALVIHERTYGVDHPYIGFDLATLAQIHQDYGELGLAREFGERAATVHEQAYGSDHPFIGFDLTLLARIHMDLGDFRVARELAQRAVSILEVGRGPDHPWTDAARAVMDRLRVA